jgi:hypothetical protein
MGEVVGLWRMSGSGLFDGRFDIRGLLSAESGAEDGGDAFATSYFDLNLVSHDSNPCHSRVLPLWMDGPIHLVRGAAYPPF